LGFIEGLVSVGDGWLWGVFGGVGDFVGFWAEDIEVFVGGWADGEVGEFHDEGGFDHACVGDVFDSSWEVIVYADEPSFHGVGADA